MRYSLSVLVAVLIAIISLMAVVVAYSRSRLVNDEISIGGMLSGNVRVGLWLVDEEGRRIYSASMTEERLLSFAISPTGSAVVEDPSKVSVYLVINVTYTVSGMEYLRANVTAVHYYERELGLEPMEPKLIRDIDSTDGTHTAVLKVNLGTLDYFLWLDYYARRYVRYDYSYPFYPPAFRDDFDYEGSPNELIWRYGGNATVHNGKLYLGLTRYPGSDLESYVKTKSSFSLGSCLTTMMVHVYAPKSLFYARLFIGKSDATEGIRIIFRNWGFTVHVQYRLVSSSGFVYRFPWSTKVYWESPGWHTLNVTFGSGGRLRVYHEGNFVCDVIWDYEYGPLEISVDQNRGTACWIEVEYVVIGPSPSDKLLDWYIHVSLFGRGRDGQYYEASKDMYASFGSGEPVMHELGIRPVGVLYYSADPSLLVFARTLSFVLDRFGI